VLPTLLLLTSLLTSCFPFLCVCEAVKVCSNVTTISSDLCPSPDQPRQRFCCTTCQGTTYRPPFRQRVLSSLLRSYFSDGLIVFLIPFSMKERSWRLRQVDFGRLLPSSLCGFLRKRVPTMFISIPIQYVCYTRTSVGTVGRGNLLKSRFSHPSHANYFLLTPMASLFC